MPRSRKLIVKKVLHKEYIIEINAKKFWNDSAVQSLIRLLDDFDLENNIVLDKLNRSHKNPSKPSCNMSERYHARKVLQKNLGLFDDKLTEFLFRPKSDYRDLYRVIYLLICDIYTHVPLANTYSHSRWLNDTKPSLHKLSNLEIVMFCNFLPYMGKRLLPYVTMLYLLELGKILNERKERDEHFDMYKDTSTAENCCKIVFDSYMSIALNMYKDMTNGEPFKMTYDFNKYLETARKFFLTTPVQPEPSPAIQPEPSSVMKPKPILYGFKYYTCSSLSLCAGIAIVLAGSAAIEKCNNQLKY